MFGFFCLYLQSYPLRISQILTTVAKEDTCRHIGYMLDFSEICREYALKKSYWRMREMRSSSWVSMELLEKILYTLVRWQHSSDANHTTVFPCSSNCSFMSCPMCIFGWGAGRFPSGICACKALINKKDVGISFAYSVIRALALPLERISNASQPTPE